MKRSVIKSIEYFTIQKEPNGSKDDVDWSVAVQASALAATVRCGHALGEKTHLDQAEQWFQGLIKAYPPSEWRVEQVPFHKFAIAWESVALVASYVNKGSSFYEDLQEFLDQIENFLWKAWQDTPAQWSFSSARAISMRWNSKALKGKKQSRLRRWAQEHFDRFIGRDSAGLADGPSKTMSEGILARIGEDKYTCGPLQGLASLASVIREPEIIQVVLSLLEKDAKKYQITSSNQLPGRFDEEVGSTLLGAFFRDIEQQKMEKRTSLRVEDTSMCLIAQTEALRVLQTIKGVDVSREDQQTSEL